MGLPCCDLLLAGLVGLEHALGHELVGGEATAGALVQVLQHKRPWLGAAIGALLMALAFWLYSILIETILPLNFYTNTLYPQAFLDYTMKLIRREDQQFFEKSGDAINFFCLKSYYSLFMNLTVDSDSEAEQERRSEMAYFMLDILFLFGDPKTSTTMMDDSREEGDGLFLVGEAIPVACLSKSAKLAQKEYPEPRVRLDRTSQLLLAMSITIADFVKQYYLRADKSKSSDIDVKIS